MKFSFATIPTDPIDARADLISLAEKLGFDGAWVPDQTFYADPYAVLGAAAVLTQRIQLGLGVTNPFTRHPVITFRAAATVDRISNGRFRLGIGAGNQRELLNPLLINSSRPARAIREMIEIGRGLLAGRTVSFHGQVFSVDEVRLEFAARPEMPIYVGGRGKQILTAAAQADGAILSVAGFRQAKAIVEQHLSRGEGRYSRPRFVLWGECLPLDTPGADIEKARRGLAHSLARAPEVGLRASGIDPNLTAAIKASFEKGGARAAATHVDDEVMRRHLIMGTTSECREQLLAFGAQGVDEFSYLIRHASVSELALRLEWFTENIIGPSRDAVARRPNTAAVDDETNG